MKAFLGTLKSTSFRDKNYGTIIRKALALGFFNQAAIHCNNYYEDVYKTVNTNQWALLDPGSSLISLDHEWVIYNKFELRAKQYVQIVTAIEPEKIVHLPYFQTENLATKIESKELKRPYVKASLDEARERLETSR
jgi:pre-mRNA-splicing factor ATP-dependent RNA helicase DHX15/PRP43